MKLNSKNWSSVRLEISDGSLKIVAFGLSWAAGHTVRLYQHDKTLRLRAPLKVSSFSVSLYY